VLSLPAHLITNPTEGAKTVNGLVTEHLGSIPGPGVTILVNNYPLEIRQTRNNAVKTLILYPRLNRPNKEDEETEDEQW